jgi:phosphoglycolate phosphatase-like HAD superfamily hydrolase
MKKRLIVFDFDGTLFHTQTPTLGEKIWSEKTGTDWPYNGWWSHPETLDTEIFYTPVNQWVYKKYLEAVSDDDNYVILATGRLAKKEGMLENIEKLLIDNNISFDEIHLNWGGDTFRFKTKLFEEKIKELGVHELIMYDDRYEHLMKFKEWKSDMNTKITIIDITKKREI